tara:strand:- start:116 stop:280 length:165 start_codon:yes stop_codon:yes gene_type:complete
MEEVIVEGLDYEDFITIKHLLTNNTVFKQSEIELLSNSSIVLEKIEKIIQVFKE